MVFVIIGVRKTFFFRLTPVVFQFDFKFIRENITLKKAYSFRRHDKTVNLVCEIRRRLVCFKKMFVEF
jgi:hypothetical protein